VARLHVRVFFTRLPLIPCLSSAESSSYLECGDHGVVSLLLLAGAKAVEGNGAGSLELRGGDEGNAHGECERAHSQDDGNLRKWTPSVSSLPHAGSDFLSADRWPPQFLLRASQIQKGLARASLSMRGVCRRVHG